MPTVDVIIPAYNASRYLPAAIESVIAQSFEDWRIILVDDGSTDDTLGVVAPFAEHLGQKLLYMRQSNRGLPAARNAAIRASTAEFLAILDADDIWLPERLAESLRPFARPDVGLTYALVSRVDPRGVLLDTLPGNLDHAEGWIAPYLYMRRVHLPCPTITFRRTCVEKVGYFDEGMRATEDRDMWFRIATRYQVAFVPKVLAYYRVSPNSLSSDPNRMFQAQQQFIAKHYGQPGCGAWARRVALSTACKERAEALCDRRQLGAALQSSLRALALFPVGIGNHRTTASLFLKWAGLKR